MFFVMGFYWIPLVISVPVEIIRGVLVSNSNQYDSSLHYVNILESFFNQYKYGYSSHTAYDMPLLKRMPTFAYQLTLALSWMSLR